MNRTFSSTTFALAAAIFLLPATGLADQISFTSFGGYGPSGASNSSPQVSIVWDTLTVNGVEYDNGTYTETYSNDTGILSIIGNTGAGSNVDIAVQIQEAMSLASTLNGSAVNLFSGATSASLGSGLLGLLGLPADPAIADLSNSSFSVVADASLPVGTQVTSAIASLTTSAPVGPTATPEPSTFAMLALAGLVGMGVRAGRKAGRGPR